MKGQRLLSRGRLNFITACGLATIFVLFAFALFSTGYDCSNNQRQEKRQASNEQGGECESWRHFATRDPAGLFTLWLAGIGFFQAGFFVWQLDLIRRGLADTKEAANASTEQTRVARESLVASHRAWVKVEALQLTQSLRIDANGARAIVRLRFRNIGNVPALSIFISMRLGVVRRDGMQIERFHADCRDIVKMPPPGEFAIFPGDAIPAEPDFMEVMAHIRPNDFEQGVTSINGATWINPLLLICVAYKFPSDPGRYHQTRMVCEIQRHDFELISPDPAIIPARDLKLIETGWEGAFYAD